MSSRRATRWILLVLLMGMVAVAAAGPAAAEPSAQPTMPPVQPGVWTDPEWLRVDYHTVAITISDQIATTEVALQFTNEGDGLAEGTFLFPLPPEAVISELIMVVDGVPIEARVLPAQDARAIYDEIVRQYRDPALLEYVSSSAIQANVFPIPPGDSRRIEITYQQVLTVDNGLVQVRYPLDATGVNSSRPVDQMNVRVSVSSAADITNVFSPTHNVAVSREGETAFSAGFEATSFTPDGDFTLYYGLDETDGPIALNLLTYRESADEDGFFMLMVQPPFEVAAEDVIPKDIIVVLDQSGSMEGEKWEQATAATAYVLDNLNPEDRFNVVLFSTGARVFSTMMEAPAIAPEAVDWVNGSAPAGGTDINLSLTRALEIADSERPTTVIFVTDGLATEGETAPETILANLESAARPNVRIFTFGVGDDVDTFLLDSIARDFRGTASYVRPGERIDEEIASFYNKVSAPVMTDIALDFGGVTAELLYPAQLPDLFAGEQLTIVGRYRASAQDVTLTLSGNVSGEAQTFAYTGQSFRARAGGEPFIARLWATRRIGDLLNTIRLSGENAELIDAIIDLSVRYGIITPYTSFLIEENDILTQAGRDRAAMDFEAEAGDMADETTGAAAVDAAEEFGGMAAAEAPQPAATVPPPGAAGSGGNGDGANAGTLPDGTLQSVGSKTFIVQGGVWIDTTFQPDTMTTEQVVFLSDAYFALLDERPELAPYFAIGERVIIVLEGVAYEVVPAEA